MAVLEITVTAADVNGNSVSETIAVTVVDLESEVAS
jgi:hypothetical protein